MRPGSSPFASVSISEHFPTFAPRLCKESACQGSRKRGGKRPVQPPPRPTRNSLNRKAVLTPPALLLLLRGMQAGAPWKTGWSVLKKLPRDPAIPLSGIYLQKTVIPKDTRTLIVTAELFITAKIRKQPRCPATEDWIKKLWHIYTQWNITQPQKEQNTAICSNRPGPREDRTK